MKNFIQHYFSLFTATCALIISIASCSSKTGMQGAWEQLGTRTVDFGLDRDEIAVTAREGFFTALKFRIDRSALNMHKMIVHFGDGSTQDVELKGSFRAGDESRIIDLAGNHRVITKVVFWYDTKNFKRRKAIIELWGRH